MRITFIGGTKFIGHAAAAAAVRGGHEVSVVHRGVHPSEVAGVETVIADRTNPSALAGALQACKPDVVIDTRAMTRRDAQNTLDAMRGTDATAVVLSSQDVYAQFGRLNGLEGPEPQPLVDEESPLTVPYPFRGIAEHDGGDEYDKKEVESEFREAVESSALSGATVLRLPATYGSRDSQRRFGIVVDALDRGETQLPHQGGASFRWTHGHVDNVAHAIVLAAEACGDGYHIFNVADSETPTMGEWAERIASEMSRKIEWQEQPDDKMPDEWGVFGKMPNDVVIDSSRIRETLGFAEILEAGDCIVDLIEGLRASREAK